MSYIISPGKSRASRRLPRLSGLFGLALLMPAFAFAAPVINTIAVKLPSDTSYGNGPVTAAVNGTVNVRVNGTSGTGLANNYKGTKWLLSTSDSGLFICLNTEDIANNSTGDITFDITVPPLLDPGTYTLYLIPYSDGGCTANPGTQKFLANAVSISAPNPVAIPDSTSVDEDASATIINVRSNDTNAGSATISAVTQPTNGAVVITNSGVDLTYQPSADYCNAGSPTDDFTYTLSPGGSTASVEVRVTCVNDAPSFTAHDAPAVNEDAGAQSGVVVGDSFSPGPGNESGQTLADCIVTSISDPGSILSAGPSVTVSGSECHLAYTPAADANGTVTFDLAVQDSGGTSPGVNTSPTQPVKITINAVNDAPSFTAHNDTSAEDDGAQSGVVVGDNFSTGPANESGQSLLACVVTNESVPDWLLSSGPTVTVSGSECHLAYTAAPNANGSFSFDLAVQDDGGTDNEGKDTSEPRTVTVTITPVNDPPTVTFLNPPSQTSDYSDDIGTVSITVTDIDDASTTLAESNEPPDSVASLDLTAGACNIDITLTPRPDEDGSTCDWTYNGQVLDPGDNVYAIDFTPSDGDGANPGGKGTHTLTIEAEDATVLYDEGNDVAVQVAAAGGASPEFHLLFSAWETNDPDYPHSGTAQFGNLNEMVPKMTLSPVGPGGPVDADDCKFLDPLPDYLVDGYGQVALFDCTFSGVPVNVYEVTASVTGLSATTLYYEGFGEGMVTVFDPSLGFTTGGGWFYWPDTAIAEDACLEYDSVEPSDCRVLDPCAPYAGDRTNFGWTMKYNRKRTNLQGSLLMMRHTIDELCEDAGNYKVKSNALNGLAIGNGNEGDDDFGWAAFSGKATFAEPGLDAVGNHLFTVYAEDHGEQGCDQDPADEFWIEVTNGGAQVLVIDDGDAGNGAGLPVDNSGASPADGDDVAIACGNIFVPHTQGNGKH